MLGKQLIILPFQSKWKEDKCKEYEGKPEKSFVDRIRKVRDSSLIKLKSMNEFKFDSEEKPKSIQDKRNKKYMAKFGYRNKLVSKRCPSGMMMGTPAFADNNGQRPIVKYLKTDEVRNYIRKI
jgi:hypothetical protein